MKKLILIFAVIFSACNAPVVEGVGFFAPMPEEKFIAGSDDITNLWSEYIDAHNERDMEKIMSMNSDSIFIQGPDGSRIFGKEQHEQALSAWFEAESPKWDIYWAMPYKSIPSGADWFIVGHRVETNVGGEKVVKNAMIDGEVKDGKIYRFFVYEALVPESPAEVEE